jgi:hypothetical protein
MKFVTKEFTIELINDSIITKKFHPDCTELTIEGMKEAIDKINVLINSNSKPKKMMMYLAPFYVKKEVMKYFINSIPTPIAFNALVCPGYIAKYVASIGVKMYNRHAKDSDHQMEIKTFLLDEKAIEWLDSMKSNS